MAPTIIGLVGLRRSGKDTAAAALQELGYTNVKFAAPMKDMLRNLFDYAGLSARTIERMIEGDLKEEPVGVLGGRSARHAMQTLGTNWGRDLVAQELWVNLCMARCAQLPLVAVSDVRFYNESEAIRNAGGRIIRITRPNNVPVDSHVSESLTLSLPADLEIINDGTIADLHDKVYAAVSALS